jgi:hypothetical protein
MSERRVKRERSIEDSDIEQLLASCKCGVTGGLIEERIHAALAAAYRLGWARHKDAVAGIFAQSEHLRCPVEMRDRGEQTEAEAAKLRAELLESIDRKD